MSEELINLIKNPKPYWNGDNTVKKLCFKFESQGLQFVGNGADRAVFRRNNSNYVVKVPHNGYGEDANYNEYKLSKEYPKYIAPCRLLGLSLIMRLLETEEVEWNSGRFPDSYLQPARLPCELRPLNDGWQVGRHPITKQLFYYDLN
jgi:hypothetical protein